MKYALIAFTVALAAPLHAQDKRSAEPADPNAAVPPIRYESPLAGYRPAGDEKAAPWKQVNKEVEGAGMLHGAHGSAKATTAPPKEHGESPKKPPASAPAKPHH